MTARVPQVTVACPKCGTRYHVPASTTERTETVYRCTRCAHMFSRTEADEPARPPRDFEIDDDALGDDLALDEDPTFDDTDESGESPAFVNARREVASSDLPPEPAFATPEPEEETEEELEVMDTTTPHGASWLRAGVRFEVLVLIVFGAIGLFLSSDPDQALQLVPPLLRADSSDGVSRHGLQQLHLAELRGVREELRGGRPAFVISGQVINDSSRAIGAVQVEGRLFSESHEISSRTVYAGTKASRQLVRSWTPTEIAMFQKIKPPKTYRLKGGAADNFLIIFQEIPDTLTEFACRVVSALPARHE